MTYLSAIKRLRLQGNLGGLVTLRVCRKADLINIPAPVGGVVYGDIEFTEDAGWIEWQVTTESLGSESKGNTTREGFTMGNRLPFTLPKGRASISNMLEQATQDEFIVLFKDGNGKNIIFGLLDSPVLFEYDHSSGRSHGDLNHYACAFFYRGPNNMFEYQGAIATAPAGPAPAVVSFNGEAIASLQPGETLNIISEYSFDDYFTTSP